MDGNKDADAIRGKKKKPHKISTTEVKKLLKYSDENLM
jgi:hypothetical protein